MKTGADNVTTSEDIANRIASRIVAKLTRQEKSVVRDLGYSLVKAAEALEADRAPRWVEAWEVSQAVRRKVNSERRDR